MRRLGIFSPFGAARDQYNADYIVSLLEGFRPCFEHLVVVANISFNPYFAKISQIADQVVGSGSERIRWPIEGYRAALTEVGVDFLSEYDEVVLFDSMNFGPLFPPNEMFDLMEKRACDFWSISHVNTELDSRLKGRFPLKSLHKLNFAAFRRPAIENVAFQEFWSEIKPVDNYFENLVKNDAQLTVRLSSAGLSGSFFIDPALCQTANPSLLEVPSLLEARCPLIEKNFFTLDPLIADRQALDARGALDWIRDNTTYDVRMIWDSFINRHPLRNIHANLDEVRIFDDLPNLAPARQWSFQPVAVFAHAFYPEMIDEFVAQVREIPVAVDLFITTASVANQQLIQDRLVELDYPGSIDVRVVEQNRGRDMSSLFITFRDVVLDGDYGLALRLHSKRTPQMSAQVGASFKAHMYENLVCNRHFVTRLFDLLEAEPNIGVVVPPVIHIGFSTLGHSWFNNRAALERVAKELGITVPLDSHTPVAAYGTMFWFRPAALRRLFEREWNWEEFNPEPHHVDGGLAHVLERLICYAAQQDKFRTICTMNTRAAARNYAKLEYKHQLIASCYPDGDIRTMYAIASQQNQQTFPLISLAGCFMRVATFYDSTKSWAPWLWRAMQPVSKAIWPSMERVIDRTRDRQSQLGDR